jgi:hypothetical protein
MLRASAFALRAPADRSGASSIGIDTAADLFGNGDDYRIARVAGNDNSDTAVTVA